jgi:4-amino-4-deoxy-L-arabinose transferase-like glycosyltransferase
LVVIPVWIAFKIWGIGLMQLRIPITIIAALTIPVFWLFARRIYSERFATVAALILLSAPTFLFAARTATIVGISLFPAIITAYILLRLIERPEKWIWLLIFLELLLVNSYAYAPIRFFWPLSILLFIVEAFFRPAKRQFFIICILVTAILPALVLTYVYKPPHLSTITAINKYFNGRGEQLFNIDQQYGYHYFIRSIPQEQLELMDEDSLRYRLILDNAQDYVTKIFALGTVPVMTKYWDHNARLYPGFLLPFFMIGLVLVCMKAWRKPAYRLILMLFWGFGIPMLLTSHVDVSRLIFTLPFLYFIIAEGFIYVMHFLARQSTKINVIHLTRDTKYMLACSISCAVFFTGITYTTWQEYHISPKNSGGEDICRTLADDVASPLPSYYTWGCSQ